MKFVTVTEKESARIRHTPLPTFLLFISFLTFPTELKLTATVNPSALDKWSHPGEIVPDAAPERLLFKGNVLPTNFTKLEHIRVRLESWRHRRGWVIRWSPLGAISAGLGRQSYMDGL